MEKFEEIVQYDDPKLGKVLREKTKEIKTIDNDVINLLSDLKELAKKNSKDGITLVGLSAPQVGWSVSVFVYFDIATRKYIDVINPKVIYESKETTTEWEGCASIGTGQKSLFGQVRRSRACQIKFLSPDNTEKIINVSNFQSHILQHEVDHLNGILFLDRIADKKDIYTTKQLDEYAKKNKGKYPD